MPPFGGALDEARAVERADVGHQRGARDAAEVKGGLVGREDAEVDDTGAEPLALGIDRFGAVRRLIRVEGGDAAVRNEQTADLAAE